MKIFTSRLQHLGSLQHFTDLLMPIFPPTVQYLSPFYSSWPIETLITENMMSYLEFMVSESPFLSDLNMRLSRNALIMSVDVQVLL